MTIPCLEEVSSWVYDMIINMPVLKAVANFFGFFKGRECESSAAPQL